MTGKKGRPEVNTEKQVGEGGKIAIKKQEQDSKQQLCCMGRERKKGREEGGKETKERFEKQGSRPMGLLFKGGITKGQ